MVAAMVEASLRVGMMTVMVIEAGRVQASCGFVLAALRGTYWGFLGSLNIKYMTVMTVAQKTTCLCQKRISPKWKKATDSPMAPIVIPHRSTGCSMTAFAQMAN